MARAWSRWAVAAIVVAVTWAASDGWAQKKKKKGDPDAPAPSRETLQKDIRPADGFDATVFAAPPDVSYPTCLAAAPNGDLFVGIDLNGSLGTKKGQGRVVRCVDRDGDGVADEFHTFCEVQHPRGLHFDKGRLLVLHPPFLSAFVDDDGDGKADRVETLVKGISTDVTFQRGADHTTNGFRRAVDGWLYIAVGDFGFVNAEGKDGKTVQFYGGGVARVRPDGTELEIVSRGQRNIYDVAVSPRLDLFTRDNTNDGGGWDVRLSHVVPLGNYGYPSRYKHFTDETLAPLADYGGGSATGSLYLHEPGFPEGFGDSLYTVEWGRQGVMRHPLTAKGAGYVADQKLFVGIPSPTDIDVDGSGRVYVSSWRGGGFNFSNPHVGFVARLTPKGWRPNPTPDYEKADEKTLLEELGGPSQFRRLAAQLAILRRGPTPTLVAGIEKIVATPGPVEPRVAGMFTYKQLLGPKSVPALTAWAKDATLREHAIRAASDRVGEAADVSTAWLTGFISDADARVRLQTLVALGRIGRSEAAAAMIPLTADADPTVAHVAVQALQRLRPLDACLQAIDQGQHLVGALRAIQEMHETRVVDALTSRLRSSTSPELRRGLLTALCRLHYQEAKWDGKWWGTRPDTTGPYFKRTAWAETERIAAALRQALADADAPTRKHLVVELRKHRIDFPEAIGPLVRLATEDAQFRPLALDLLVSGSNVPKEAYGLLHAEAKAVKSPLRAKSLRALHRLMDQPETLALAFDAFASLEPGDLKNKELNAAWEDFTRDSRHGQRLGAAADLLDAKAATSSRLLGMAILVNAATNQLAPAAQRADAQKRLEPAWRDAALAAPLVRAVEKAKGVAFADSLRMVATSGIGEAKSAAADALKTLGIAQARATLKGRPYADVLAEAMKLPGDPKQGEAIFLAVNCINCHTVRPTEPLKGPYLGDIAARLKRPDLLESILKPNAKIVQGFETIFFEMSDGKVIEGFIVRESGEEVELRNNAGVVISLAKAKIESRGRREISVMPESLVDNLTVPELSSLVAYLESLNVPPKKTKK